MKPEDVPDCIGKTLASQNDLLVTEHEKMLAEANVAYYAREVGKLKAKITRLRELLEEL
jgi:hypothetical protein